MGVASRPGHGARRFRGSLHDHQLRCLSLRRQRYASLPCQRRRRKRVAAVPHGARLHRSLSGAGWHSQDLATVAERSARPRVDSNRRPRAHRQSRQLWQRQPARPRSPAHRRRPGTDTHAADQQSWRLLGERVSRSHSTQQDRQRARQPLPRPQRLARVIHQDVTAEARRTDVLGTVAGSPKQQTARNRSGQNPDFFQPSKAFSVSRRLCGDKSRLADVRDDSCGGELDRKRIADRIASFAPDRSQHIRPAVEVDDAAGVGSVGHIDREGWLWAHEAERP